MRTLLACGDRRAELWRAHPRRSPQNRPRKFCLVSAFVPCVTREQLVPDDQTRDLRSLPLVSGTLLACCSLTHALTDAQSPSPRAIFHLLSSTTQTSLTTRSSLLVAPTPSTMASADQLSKVDSAIEAGDAKDAKTSHRRASSTASNVHNIVDLGKLDPRR